MIRNDRRTRMRLMAGLGLDPAGCHVFPAEPDAGLSGFTRTPAIAT
jgi:hypothetical protein